MLSDGGIDRALSGAHRNGAGLYFCPRGCDNGASPGQKTGPRLFLPSYTDRKGTVANSLQVDNEKILYAQLNYREGRQMIKSQLEPVAKKNYGGKYRPKDFENALDSGYRAQGVVSALHVRGKPAGYGKDKG